MRVYNSTISGNILSSDAGQSTVSKDGFLKILAAQLQNQDPLNAKDNSEYVAQMAQFSALEQMQNLNQAMGQLLVSQKFEEGNLMIGKIAKISLGDNQLIEGEVTSVKFVGNQINVVVGDKEYNIDDVVALVKKESEDNVVPNS